MLRSMPHGDKLLGAMSNGRDMPRSSLRFVADDLRFNAQKSRLLARRKAARDGRGGLTAAAA